MPRNTSLPQRLRRLDDVDDGVQSTADENFKLVTVRFDEVSASINGIAEWRTAGIDRQRALRDL